MNECYADYEHQISKMLIIKKLKLGLIPIISVI